jgi:hypothetical protein
MTVLTRIGGMHPATAAIGNRVTVAGGRDDARIGTAIGLAVYSYRIGDCDRCNSESSYGKYPERTFLHKPLHVLGRMPTTHLSVARIELVVSTARLFDVWSEEGDRIRMKKRQRKGQWIYPGL